MQIGNPQENRRYQKIEKVQVYDRFAAWCAPAPIRRQVNCLKEQRDTRARG
jgi:hypothetical protein